MTKKSGYVAIVGKPNSGKSTLLNAVLNTKLSIVTPKIQTTRKRVLGIFTSDNTQIIFIDTPGLLKPMHNLHKAMMEYVELSIKESDVILLIIDTDKYKTFDEYFSDVTINQLRNISKPIIVALNKTDLIENKKKLLPVIKELTDYKFISEVIPISAKKNDGLDTLVLCLEKYLPSGEFFYDAEYLSTQPVRFFVSEMIREVIFLNYEKEIPYSTEVFINEFKERSDGKWFISADIIVEKQSQKGIIIGAGGKKLKSIGEKSRKEIEEYLQKEIYLELFVKVRDNWRKKPVFLKSFGY
ncbi:GTPase Era [Bacteroidetes/Chlorobi group bacterium ChocPot_Mid]|jgi:GTP-binding protein Era|nr:MAG: GTPase Era [Bacteroidetes/Chlorobi group bacterium ChocPot_Mid]